MSEDICERLVRFNQHKECVSTDLEVEAAAEITRLREENARLAALSAKASLEASQLREALSYYAEENYNGYNGSGACARAAIREGGKDGE